MTRAGHGPSAALVGLVAAGLVLAGGMAWTFASPLMSVPDEPQHTLKAAAVVRGQLRGAEEVNRTEDPDELNLTYTKVVLDAGYDGLNRLPLCYIGDPGTSAACSPPVPDSDAPATVDTTMGRYPPLYYGLVGAPTLLFETTPAVYAMRTLGVVLAAALLGLAGVAAWWARRSVLPLAGLALALTPMGLYLAGSVNASGFEIAAAIAAWSTGLAVLAGRGGDPRPRWLVWSAATAAAAFILARPASLALWAGTVLVLAVAAADPDVLRAPWPRPAVRRAAALVGATALVAAAWLVLADPLSSFIGAPRPDLTPAAAARTSVGLTPRRLQEMIGWFGWLDTPAPAIVRYGWLGLWGVVLAAAAIVGSWRQRVALTLLTAAVVLLPVLSEARAAGQIGFAWQGRYTLPLAAGLPILAAWVLADRLPARARRAAAWAVPGLVLLLGMAHVAALAAALRRFAVGVPAPLFSFLEDPAWRPPVPPGLLVAVLAVVAVAAALLVGAARLRQATTSWRNLPV